MLNYISSYLTMYEIMPVRTEESAMLIGQKFLGHKKAANYSVVN